jgi:hypothetical protein
MADVMEFQAFNVNLKLLHFGVVGIHRVLLDVAHLIDLIDDDLGVAVSDEPLDSQGNIDAQSMEQGLVFSAVVMDLQDVFQVISLRGDEEYACACSFKV